MKKIRYLLFTAWCALLMAQPDNKSSGVILLQQKEAEEIFSSSVPYVYFGSEVSSLVADLPNIEHDLGNTDVYHDDLSTLCKRIAQGDTTAPLNTVVAALTQARDHLHCNNHDDSCALLAHNIETMLNTVASGHLTIGISTDTLPDVTDTLLRAPREDGTSASCCPKPCNNPYLNANCLLLEHNALIKGNVSIAGDERVCGSVLICNNLTVNGNETVHGDLTVTGTLFATVTPIFFADLELIGTPQERCIIFYDALMNEKARICDYPTAGEHGLFISVDGGVTQNVQVNNGGGVVIDAPTSGDALAVTGNTGSPAIVATGNSTTTAPALQLINNPAASATDFFLTINAAGDITESTLTTSNFIANGCQSGPITIGTANASSVILATNGCTPRLTIDQNGAVSIATPSAGTGLTVNGGGVVIDAPTSGDALMVTGNTGSPAIVATGHGTTTAPALQLLNNPAASATDFFLTINAAGDVTESTLTTSNFIANGCQTGPITIGTANASSVTVATNGCTPRVTIDQNGAVSIATPSAGTGLTVNGGGVVIDAPTSGDALMVTGNTGSPAIVAIGNSTTTAPALQLLNNPAASATDFFLTINAAGDVTESTLTTSNFIANGCQSGPITIGTANASSVILATNGCTPRLTIDQNGAVAIASPTVGTGLTVNGGGVVVAAPTSGDALMVTGNTGSPAIVATGNSTTTAPALQLLNNPAASATDFFLTINAAGDVTESTLTTSNFIANGCQSGPITIGTANASSVTVATNGCTPRLTIDQNGAVSIASPTAGTGLTVNGGGVVIDAPTSDDALMVTGNTGSPAIVATGNSTTTAPALQLLNNPAASATDFFLTINAAGDITESTLTTSNFIANGCQSGPITIGTANASSVILATNGCTPRLTIDQNGAVSIATPSAGTGLTVNGGGVVVAAPSAGDALAVTGNTGSPAIVATGHGTTTAPALQLLNNPAASATDFFLTINAAGDVTESTLTTSNFIANGCQSGPITIGTANASSVILATNGCTPRLTIDQNGAVSIATPSAGTGLTVSGSGETISAGNLNISTGNIMLPSTNSTGKQGLFELGTSASNIVLYKFGGRNFFAGNYTATNTGVTGTDNISFGSNTNSTLTTANYVIAIGDDAVATGTDSIAIGDKAKATALRTIVLGSKDSTSTGAAPTATALNAIAIGSANGTNAGASATGISAIAIGGADAASAKGAAAAGNRAIALGTNASSTGILSIAVGSASGTAGGTGPSTTGGATNAIVIGSANSAIAGASSNSVAAIGIGGSDGVFTGATADGIRTIAIGVAALAQSDSGVLIGSASGTAGGVGPNAVNRAAICIGSASGALRAANSGNISTIAIGGSDGVFAGASALGGRCIAIGQNASVPNAGAGSIALGSSSGAVGGTAPTVSGATSVAIGSANGALSGPSATGAGAVVIGASDGIASGASATANRSVAIGTGATATLADNVIFGNSASTNMRVGIGSNTPTSRLHVVGANGTPIITINQVAVAIGNAPIWKNPSVSAIAGTPIHYNASNHLFGFTSSKRYKTNIRDVFNESDILYTLTPVIYDSKPEFGSGNNIPGFIAEDVYEVAPNLVILNSDGEPENVAYNYLHALVIKEIQKHALQLSILSISLQDNQDSLNALETQVASLNTQLNQLEICVVNKKTGRDISSG